MSPHSSTPPPARRHGDRTRAEWVAYADRLLGGAAKWASPGNALITPPGAEGGYGRAVDGLEGFARTFLLAGFRIAGDEGRGLTELIEFYSRGIRTGVDPDAPDRWVRLDEHPQAKVEAASIALMLDLTRPWIWEQFDETTRARVIDYLAPAVGDQTYPRTNWLWFRLVVQTFLRSVGGPWSPDDVAADLALHDSFARADGWMSDGHERSYDHYVGWALHLYPVLWSRMAGAAELAGGRTEHDVVALDRYLQDAIALVGADGSPLIQGRSLIYRFAAAAPFWVGALAEVPSLSPGALRHAADRIVQHFDDHGVPDRAGLLTMGWHGEWRGLAQSYSGPASPYWAAKGLLGIALPADHPVWSAPAEPLPVESGDFVRVVRAAGWAISGTRADGIVRIANHGTDHAAAGDLVGDSPLYARIGYSTATAPLLDDRAWVDPLDQSVALVDADGEATHRAGMELTEVRLDDDGHSPVAVAASTSVAHLVRPDHELPRHGSGLGGEAVPLGRINVQSIVRGPWEVRLVSVDALEDGVSPESLRLRIGGWPVAGDAPVAGVTDHGFAHAAVGGRVSAIHPLRGDASGRIEVRRGASILGATAVVPVLEYPVVPGERIAVLVELGGATVDAATAKPAQLELIDADAESVVDITWPDGRRTASRLSDPRPATTARR
ncbi:DUF2264 domain-containing protein [Agromyces intestinalis]|uniref:DUF2264 domain-containing protein n=1 Tax=Agromyces intestinalis TaxID=2592652 RepID=A0A5C1YF50_9MICO|nr:DUF2264 domain-containing protein [Agromyces intestinalis]QEO14080.1 DUF2264 domain-containing protein [Agromyces intestinalis]